MAMGFGCRTQRISALCFSECQVLAVKAATVGLNMGGGQCLVTSQKFRKTEQPGQDLLWSKGGLPAS